MTCDVTRFRKESDRRQSSQSTIRTRSVTLPLLLTGKKAFLTTVFARNGFFGPTIGLEQAATRAVAVANVASAGARTPGQRKEEGPVRTLCSSA